MSETHLTSLADYSRFVAEVLNRTNITSSTVAIWSDSRGTGIAEGEVFFARGIRLRLREELDFEAGLITSYGYEVYRDNERLFWYDDFPHPDDPLLASTFPHHKHVPPDIRHHRIPAPGLSFTKANLPFLVAEIEMIGG
jgi:hypothetical protein